MPADDSFAWVGKLNLYLANERPYLKELGGTADLKWPARVKRGALIELIQVLPCCVTEIAHQSTSPHTSLCCRK